MPKPTGKVIKMWEHKGWGDRIGWTDFQKRRIDGHLTPPPNVGDELQADMESGKRARFLITAIDYCYDPHDMFFADVTDIGYVDERPLNPNFL